MANFVWYVGLYGSEGEPIPTPIDDFNAIAATKDEPKSGQLTMTFEQWTKTLAVADLYGFAPRGFPVWRHWPPYYSVYTPEEPRFWWDSSPSRVRFFSEAEWEQFADTLAEATQDGLSKGRSTLESWIPSVRRRRYREALEAFDPKLVKSILERCRKGAKTWEVTKRGFSL
jgi:hypothetical protein